MSGTRFRLLAVAAIVLIFLSASIVWSQIHPAAAPAKPKATATLPKTTAISAESPEIKAIKSSSNLEWQVTVYRQLMDRVGPEEAQDQLYHSGLPFTGETHLLNHEAGDYIYEKYGNKGLSMCRDYFLSSCYHGFVLHIIAANQAKTMANIAEVMAACQAKASYVATQCSHAIGHGFLAASGYANLTKALARCDSVPKSITSFTPYNCYDGVFMENIWAVHEGTPSPDRWVKTGDLTYPCTDKRIAEVYLKACWAEQPTIAYQQSKGDIKAVADVCAQVKTDYMGTCYDALARQIHPLTQNDPDKAVSLCAQVGEKWNDACLESVAGAAFSVGDRNAPFIICTKVSTATKSDCYGRLSAMIQQYAKTPAEKTEWCNKITEDTYRRYCPF